MTDWDRQERASMMNFLFVMSRVGGYLWTSYIDVCLLLSSHSHWQSFHIIHKKIDRNGRESGTSLKCVYSSTWIILSTFFLLEYRCWIRIKHQRTESSIQRRTSFDERIRLRNAEAYKYNKSNKEHLIISISRQTFFFSIICRCCVLSLIIQFLSSSLLIVTFLVFVINESFFWCFIIVKLFFRALINVFFSFSLSHLSYLKCG